MADSTLLPTPPTQLKTELSTDSFEVSEVTMTGSTFIPSPPTQITTELSSDSISTTARGSEVHSPFSERTNSTPASELSSIEALREFKSTKIGVSKANARAKAATLSLVEQVCGISDE